MHFKYLFPLVLFNSLSGVAADSGYYDSCNSVSIYFATRNRILLEGNCRQISGIYGVGVSLILTSCFANSGGNLVGRVR